jgi:hypothetical protein
MKRRTNRLNTQSSSCKESANISPGRKKNKKEAVSKGQPFFVSNFSWVDNMKMIVNKEGGCLPLQASQV